MRRATVLGALALRTLCFSAAACGGYGGGTYGSSYGPAAPQRLLRGDLTGAADTTAVARAAHDGSVSA